MKVFLSALRKTLLVNKDSVTKIKLEDNEMHNKVVLGFKGLAKHLYFLKSDLT